MKYNFIKGDLPLKERILNHYQINEDDLNINKYENITFDQKILEFKDILLSLKNQSFLIVGDADCDGICATVIIKRLLDHLNIKNNYYIPSRANEGFGINEDIINLAYKHHYDVVLALDNGIANKDVMILCQELNIKYLIIDHHEYDEEPNCLSYLHPNILSDDFKSLSAGGLSSLLASSIYEDDLNIVFGGLAVLADMVGVLKYNRYLIQKMLEILNKKNIYQINYLANTNEYTYRTLIFDVIPKINTFTRLNLNVNLLVKYLLEEENYCRINSTNINNYNNQRKELTNQMSIKAKELIEEDKDIIILEDESFLEGLCGLIANKLLNEYKKPIIVLSSQEELYKGSARSLKGLDLFSYLKDFNKFETFGGHPQALGLTIKKDNYLELLDYINTHEIKYEEYIEDVFILNEDELNINTYKLFEDLKPYGIDFKEMIFGIEINNKDLEKRIMANKYPKYIINDHCSAISFNEDFLDKDFKLIIGSLNIDKFNKNNLSFIIEDLL